MPSVNLRRIVLGQSGAAEALARLRAHLGGSGNVGSEKGRALTRRVFGEELTPQQVVERILRDVRTRGLPALVEYTDHFDGVRLTPDTLRVSDSELRLAHAAAAVPFLETIRRV